MLLEYYFNDTTKIANLLNDKIKCGMNIKNKCIKVIDNLDHSFLSIEDDRNINLSNCTIEDLEYNIITCLVKTPYKNIIDLSNNNFLQIVLVFICKIIQSQFHKYIMTKQKKMVFVSGKYKHYILITPNEDFKSRHYEWTCCFNCNAKHIEDHIINYLKFLKESGELFYTLVDENNKQYHEFWFSIVLTKRGKYNTNYLDKCIRATKSRLKKKKMNFILKKYYSYKYGKEEFIFLGKDISAEKVLYFNEHREKYKHVMNELLNVTSKKSASTDYKSLLFEYQNRPDYIKNKCAEVSELYNYNKDNLFLTSIKNKMSPHFDSNVMIHKIAKQPELARETLAQSRNVQNIKDLAEYPEIFNRVSNLFVYFSLEDINLLCDLTALHEKLVLLNFEPFLFKQLSFILFFKIMIPLHKPGAFSAFLFDIFNTLKKKLKGGIDLTQDLIKKIRTISVKKNYTILDMSSAVFMTMLCTGLFINASPNSGPSLPPLYNELKGTIVGNMFEILRKVGSSLIFEVFYTMSYFTNAAIRGGALKAKVDLLMDIAANSKKSPK